MGLREIMEIAYTLMTTEGWGHDETSGSSSGEALTLLTAAFAPNFPNYCSERKHVKYFSSLGNGDFFYS